MPDEFKEMIESFSNKPKNCKLWGDHIKCVLPNDPLPDTSMLQVKN